MTDKEFYAHSKRALERLNPRVLSSGCAYVNDTPSGPACCANGAYLAARSAMAQVKRLERRDLNAAQHEGWLMFSERPTAYVLTNNANEGYKNDDNSLRVMKARWKHVYKFVCSKL